MANGPNHTQVNSDPVSTPGYWRWFVSWIMMRYGIRGGVDIAFGKNKGDEKDNNRIPFTGRSVGDGEFEDTKDKVTDVLNGVLSTTATTVYAVRVAHDIKNVFAEAIGYEMDKDPSQVGYRDILRSENKLVQKTRQNYRNFNIARYFTDSIFFLRLFPGGEGIYKTTKNKKFNFGGRAFRGNEIGTDMAMGSKGLMLSYEISLRGTTFFDDTLRFINQKVNPVQALGDQITVSDVVDLYQKFAINHEPHNVFKGNGDTERWEKSEIIFERIADLMNESYRYRHANAIQTKQNFELPKYLYMMGTGYMDTRNVNRTLAYVEVANKHGIPALKRMRKELEKGKPLEDMLKEYDIVLPVTRGVTSRTQVPDLHAPETQKTPYTETIRANGDGRISSNNRRSPMEQILTRATETAAAPGPVR